MMIKKQTIRNKDYEIELFDADGMRLDVDLPPERTLVAACGAGNVVLLTGQASRYVVKQIVYVAEKPEEPK